MASYPSYSQGLESRVTYDDGRLSDRSEGGTLKSRVLYPARKATYRVVHPYLTNAQRDTLLSFYDANTTAVVEFTWHGDTTPVAVQVKFLEVPVLTPHGGGRWRAEVRLGQV